MYKKIVFVCFVLLSAIYPCYADIIDDNRAQITKIEEYLNSFSTLQADFLQKTPDGRAEGKIYIVRPDKIRLEYTSKNMPITVAINKEVLYYQDRSLDQISQISTPKTIASIFTGSTLSFSNPDILVKSFRETNEAYIISLEKKGHPDEGEFIMYFSKLPDLAIYRVDVRIPDTDQINSIKLLNLRYNQEIDGSIFRIRNKL